MTKSGDGLQQVDLNAAPNGVNRYFENVDGMYLEAALNCMAVHGRIALRRMIAVYNNTERPWRTSDRITLNAG
ncbi:MAG: hypothetical protein AAGC95_18555 [Pseudomonadota bacterium]